MNCRNCGAAMELFDRRRYYFCRFCGTFHFIETPGVDGIRVLERPHDGRACSFCKAPLVKALLDDVFPVEHCEQCRGLLIARSAFAEAIGWRRARASGPPAPAVPLDERELKRTLACPSCRAQMDLHPYYGPGNVLIDSCKQCDLIWLDFGELTQISEAPGRDRGRWPSDTRLVDDRPTAQDTQSDGRRRISLMDLFDALQDD